MQVCRQHTTAIILFTMLPKLFFISILSSLIFTHSYNTQCLDHQKALLLQLKNELIFNSSISTKLVQWNQTHECCKWYGVECDGAGNVISLKLNNESISGGIGESSSLFRLVYLQKLNLAYNDFNYTSIPKGIQSLTHFTHLNLSYAGFGEISGLRRLVSLDISNYSTILNLETLLQNLTGLRELYLENALISDDGLRDWSHIISSYLPDITNLSLRFCYLHGPLARPFWQLRSLSVLRLDGNDLSSVNLDLFANFSSLITLSLADCRLSGSFPSTIFHMPSLQNLDLSYNFFLSGSIPPIFIQTGSLKSMVLTSTNLSGSIPSSISNLKSLSHIDLSYCQFTGSIPSTIANLTELTYVNLYGNGFTGSLPSTLFGGLSNLVHLDLSHNQLEGSIPDSFFQLQSLESVLLSANLFNGTFQLDKIQSFPNLAYLDLSGNNLSVHVSNDNASAYGLPRLQGLELSSCNMHDFPDFIKHSDMISVLDLSNNRIGGEIPSWIWGTQLQRLNLSLNLLTHLQKPYYIPASLYSLDLRSNQLRGELHLLIPPNIAPDLRFLLLSRNSFSGTIPTSLCTATNLYVLDLSVNKLSGSIPSCLLDDTMSLTVFDLGSNNISGLIPDNLSLDCSLKYLDLNNNTLKGKIPKSLQSCKSLMFMNVGNNNFDDTFPCMLPSSLRVLVMNSNRFHGEVRCHNSWPDLQILDISSNHFSGSLEPINFSSWRSMVLDNDAKSSLGYDPFLSFGVTLNMKGLKLDLIKIWQDFTTLDFSCNNFQGEIPSAIGDLSSLRLLNLSHNALKGSIPKSFGQLGKLESLDLSRNQLTGEIPMALTGLTSLSFLNVSYNKLVGEIPNGRQLQTFSADSFKGNPELCGFVNLNISCTHIVLSPPEHENVREIEWEYVSLALGYVVGLGSIVWLLLFCRSFRQKYFDKIDGVVEEIFDARDRRRREGARRRLVRNRVQRQ